jgi:hypothetical protein
LTRPAAGCDKSATGCTRGTRIAPDATTSASHGNAIVKFKPNAQVRCSTTATLVSTTSARLATTVEAACSASPYSSSSTDVNMKFVRNIDQDSGCFASLTTVAPLCTVNFKPDVHGSIGYLPGLLLAGVFECNGAF